MKNSPSHLQTDEPTMTFEAWYEELCKLYAKAENISPTAAMRYMNVTQAMEWWEDGFTPYCTFRENYSRI